MQALEDSMIFDQDPFTLNRELLFEITLALGRAWENHAKHIPSALQNTQSITFNEAQKTELRTILEYRVTPYLNAATSPEQYEHFLAVACEYLELRVRLIQARHTNDISRFQGFSNFNQFEASDRIAILNVLITENKTFFDYSTPYQFGRVLHAQTGTSGMDFVFNTVPAVLIDGDAVDSIGNNTVYIELASPPYGIDRDAAREKGLNVIMAQSLPGRISPKTTAGYIVQTIYGDIYGEGL